MRTRHEWLSAQQFTIALTNTHTWDHFRPTTRREGTGYVNDAGTGGRSLRGRAVVASDWAASGEVHPRSMARGSWVARAHCVPSQAGIRLVDGDALALVPLGLLDSALVVCRLRGGQSPRVPTFFTALELSIPLTDATGYATVWWSMFCRSRSTATACHSREPWMDTVWPVQ